MILLQVSTQVASLQKLLGDLYDEMLPLCSDLINVGRALGALGALFFIAIRVWRHQAEASAIEFFPLLRPFAIGLAISLFPQMLGILNGVLGGLSSATASMVLVQNQNIIRLKDRKEELLKARPENAPFEDDALFEKELENKDALDFGGKAALYFDRMSYNVQKDFREWMRNALELGYQSAALVINTIRTFFLIILSIIGPISFGFAIWPGFEGTLSNWFSRYVNVFMWLPVANIFGAIIAKIQVMMITLDIAQIQANGELEKADLGYMIFLVIAICGYFTVPSVASWIVSASSLTNITRYATTAGNAAASMAGGAAGAAGGQVVGRAIAAGQQFFGGGGQQPSGGGQGNNGYQNTNKAA